MNLRPAKFNVAIFYLVILNSQLLTHVTLAQSPRNSEAQKEEMMDAVQQEILSVEQAFQKMTETSGIAEAFNYYATPDAVIKRNEKLIKGRGNIFSYYQQEMFRKASVQWTSDFIDVSSAGDMAFSYGKYVWKIPDANGVVGEYRGVYFTVWKRQMDGTWKYVWD